MFVIVSCFCLVYDWFGFFSTKPNGFFLIKQNKDLAYVIQYLNIYLLVFSENQWKFRRKKKKKRKEKKRKEKEKEKKLYNKRENK